MTTFIVLFAAITLVVALCDLRKFRSMAYTDSLTGCQNKRAWLEDTARLQARGACFSVILFDLANLKAANALLGHMGADEILAEIAGVIRNEVDVVFRTGGDEFAVLMPGADAQAAARVQARIEERVGLRYLAPEAPVFLAGATGRWTPGHDFATHLRTIDHELEKRKAARKIALGVPTSREAVLALI